MLVFIKTTLILFMLGLATSLSAESIFLPQSSETTPNETYKAGHQALEIWNAEGQANAPEAVKNWLYFMVASFALGLFFIRQHIEARLAVGGIVLGLITTRALIPAIGILKLSGLVALVHLIFWTPALYLLLKNKPFMDLFDANKRSLFSLWSGLITGVIIISFVFDSRDSIIYLDHILGIKVFS